MQLTNNGYNQAGSAFYFNPTLIDAFATDFTLYLSSSSDAIPLLDIADGVTFTIQNTTPTALGDYGEALGYALIGQSVAIKFDLHDNTGEGPDSTGLYINGAMPSSPSVNLAGTGIDLHSGDPIAVHISYNKYAGSELTMTLTDAVTLATWSHSFPINIPSILGSTEGFMGFTGATGANTATQQVLNWTYTSLPH